MNQVESFTKQTHSTSAMLYALSRLFERAGYYGVRTILVLYLMSEGIGKSTMEALSFYGTFTMIIYLSKVFGAILGDLAIGNRTAMIVGGGLQIIGAIILCFPTVSSMYIGVGLIVLGTGMYDPNAIAQFGKQYIDKTKIMDSGYGIFYIGVNIGAFIGAFTLGFVIDEVYTGGFALAAFFFVVATLVLILIKPKIINKEELKDLKVPQRKKYILLIFFGMIMSSVFWIFYEITSTEMIIFLRDVMQVPFVDTHINPSVIISSVNFGTLLIFGGVFSLIWFYNYSSPLVKLAIGFVLAGLAYLIMSQVPVVSTDNSFIIYLTAAIILSIAEFFVIPPILTLTTLHTNPKYLALVMAGFGLFTAVAMKGTSYLYIALEMFEHIPYFSLYFAGIALPSLGLLIYVIYYLLKVNTEIFNTDSISVLDDDMN